MNRWVKAAAWIGLPLLVAEPVSSVVFTYGLWDLNPPAGMTAWKIAVALPRYLWLYPKDAGVQWWAITGAGVGLSVAVVGLGIAAWVMVQRRRALSPAVAGQVPRPPERANSLTHGDADWMPMQEAMELFPGEHPDWGGIPVGEAYRPDLDRTKRDFDEAAPETWGQGGKARLLMSPLTSGALGGIIIAGSGSLKTVSFTIPALCTWRGSVVVLDTKASLGAMVEDMRRDMGHTVALIDPEKGTGSFNALGCINIEDRLAVVHVMEFINWCIPPNPKEKEGKDGGFFADSARELGCCIMWDMLTDPALPRAARTVAEWRARVVEPEETMRPMLARVYARSTSSYARHLAGNQMRTVKETFSGVYKHLGTATSFLSVPAFGEMLSGNDFSVADIVRGKLTIIVQIQDDALESAPGLSKIVIGSIARTILQAKGKVASPIPFILDEVDTLKHLPILATLRDRGRSSGVALFPVWQSAGQIAQTWGEDGKTSWYASAAWRLYAAINDENTAKEVEARCGSYTILSHSEGTSRSSQGVFSGRNGGGQTRGRSETISEQPKRLLSAYDAQTKLRPDEAILIAKGRPAIRCGRPLYWRRPEMASLIHQPEEAAP